ncbi:hypothetical protein BJY59DRAFT_180172 [Rhodotorula toruloides]
MRRDSDWRLLKRRNVTPGQHMRPTPVRRAFLAARNMLNNSRRRPDEGPRPTSRLAQISSCVNLHPLSHSSLTSRCFTQLRSMPLRSLRSRKLADMLSDIPTTRKLDATSKRPRRSFATSMSVTSASTRISPPNTAGFAPTRTLDPKTSKKRIVVITSLRFTRSLATVRVYPTPSRNSTRPTGARLTTTLASPICATRFSSTETHLRRQKGRKRHFGTVSILHTDFRQLRPRTSMPSRPSTVAELSSTSSGMKALRRLSSSMRKSGCVVPRTMPRRRLVMSRCSLHAVTASSMLTGLSARRSSTTSMSVTTQI